MVKIIYLFIFLLIILLIKEVFFKEAFTNKINNNYILVIPNDDNKCNKYIFYNNDKSIVESDNKKCYWCLNKKEVLHSIVKKTFNNNFNNIKIERFDDFKYNIYLKGNKEFNYILKKKDYKKYILYENNTPIYDIYYHNLDDNEVLTIRNNDFKKCAIVSNKQNVFDNNYNRNAYKYDYKVLDKEFENKEILGYSIFKLIQEISRDFSCSV